MKLPVRGTNFVKDTKTGALLTVNPSVLAENEARKRLKAKNYDFLRNTISVTFYFIFKAIKDNFWNKNILLRNYYCFIQIQKTYLASFSALALLLKG